MTFVASRRSRHEPAVAARPVPVADRARRVEPHRARRRSAHAAVESPARRSLRHATRAQGAVAAAGSRVRQSRISCGRARASRVRDDLHLHFVAFDLARSADGQLVGRQRSHAGAVGGRLCAREPRRLVAVLAGAVRGAQRAPAREFLPRVLRALLEPVGPRPAASRVLVAGPVEAELLRARVSRALLGLQRRRGLRSHGARRPRLFEDGRGAQARRPDHAPHRLRALRSARAAHRFADRRARASCRRRAPARSRSAMRSGRASSRAIRS